MPKNTAASTATIARPQVRIRSDRPIMIRVSSGSVCLVCVKTAATCGTT